MFLDGGDPRNIALYGVHEPFGTELVTCEVKSGDVVLDLGAHIGYYTLLLAKLVGPHGKVFAFEPEPGNFAVLRRNVKLNRCGNVVLSRKAAYNQNKIVKLYLCDLNSGMHRLHESVHCNRTIDVEGVRLDDYFSGQDIRFDFIKLDVEGAELSALKGMTRLLEKSNRVKLLTEFAPAHLAEAGVDAGAFLRFLCECGFQVYYLNRSDRRLQRVADSMLLKKFTSENGKLGYLWCVRQDRPSGLGSFVESISIARRAWRS